MTRLIVATVLVVTASTGPRESRDDPLAAVHITATTTAVAGPPLVAAVDGLPRAQRGPVRQMAPDPFVPLIPYNLPCRQWLDLALDVGWPLETIPAVAYIINRESTCNPNAQGSLVCNAHGCARALGLMQLLGWSCPPGGCLDPASNLRRAELLWEQSGWRPWCLNGDPVTGRC